MSKPGPIIADPRYLELKDRFAGLVVLLGSMVFCIGLSLWAKGVVRPEAQVAATPNTTRGIVGWPHSVDPIATLEAARRSSRPRDLRRITLDGVKSDGSIDLVTGPGSVSYLFHSALRKPKPKTPSEASSKNNYCPRQEIRISRDGLDPQAQLKEYHCPDLVSEPLPVPACGPRDVWVRALAKGASLRNMAHMEYYRSKSGPVWKMEIPSGRFKMFLTGDCQHELTARESIVAPN